MDVFKLAFETTIVGLLAFLWLGMAVDLVYPAFFAKIVVLGHTVNYKTLRKICSQA